MAKLPASFLQRNHTYEIPQVGYHRTVPIEAVDSQTFKDKSKGTKGWLVIEPNCKIFISIVSFMDDGKIGIFVEKFDAYGKAKEPFGVLIDRDSLTQIIEKPERY